MELCRLKSNRGFTLLEVIFTLSMLSIIVSLSAPIIFSILDSQSEKQFFDLLFSDLLLIQIASHGVNSGKAYVEFEDYSYTVHVDKNGYKRKIKRSYPSGWKKDERLFDEISFKNGTIRKPGTILIQSENTDYRIIFPLGKGRGYVDKQ